MFSVPYSRYVVYPIPWYSFLIVLGAAIAVFLASREEKRSGLRKDTVIDLALWVLPAGIIGARIYYVAFSWDQFKDDLLSVLRIWEGGIAIYGAVIAGLIVVYFFSRARKISPLTLCDIIVPGLALAQGIGRWGNYFNMEAYGIPIANPSLCFFPLAVQIPEGSGYVWHAATFFYESVWDTAVFLFLFFPGRKNLRKTGDLFFFYLFLYAAGRLIVEDLRMDSLYAASGVRASQLLSVILCICILFRYAYLRKKAGSLNLFHLLLLLLSAFVSLPMLADTLGFPLFSSLSAGLRVLILTLYSGIMILSLFTVYFSITQEENHADNQA